MFTAVTPSAAFYHPPSRPASGGRYVGSRRRDERLWRRVKWEEVFLKEYVTRWQRQELEPICNLTIMKENIRHLIT